MIMEIIVGRRAAVACVGRNAAVVYSSEAAWSLPGAGSQKEPGLQEVSYGKGPEVQAPALLSVL